MTLGLKKGPLELPASTCRAALKDSRSEGLAKRISAKVRKAKGLRSSKNLQINHTLTYCNNL